MTPFRSTVANTPESRFNYIHAQTRNAVERTIGVLKERFRCILGERQLHYSPKTAGKITSVCAALHNICIHYKIEAPQISINETIEPLGLETDEDSTAANIRIKIMEAMIV